MIKILARCVRDECKRAFSLNIVMFSLKHCGVLVQTLRRFNSNTAAFQKRHNKKTPPIPEGTRGVDLISIRSNIDPKYRSPYGSDPLVDPVVDVGFQAL